MPANTHVRLLTSAALFLACSNVMTQAAFAQTVQTDEYLYIGVEAEDFDSGDERWVVTNASTPGIAQDPDGNHSDTASGGVYLELLPDVRVTHNDAFGPPTAYWGQAGQGPILSYTVTFPEAGRYYVHGRAFATGTEDNGIHVGLNGGWPVSGRTMQFCTAGSNAWSWRSSQREAGGNGPCGIEKTIYLDIPTAGDHTVAFSGREDGFELDRFALIKDKSDNTRVCSPTTATGVSCKNGSIESADSFVDLRLLLEADGTEADVGDTINFTVTLENLDAFDKATDVEISVSAGADATLSSNNADCNSSGGNLVCDVGQLSPTAPDENEVFEFSLVVSEGGEYVVEAVATSDEDDEFPGSNTVSQSVVFDALDISTDINVELSATAVTLEIDDSATLSMIVSNTGSFTADQVNASVSLPSELEITSMPSACGGLSLILCGLGGIDSQDSVQLDFGVKAITAGSVNAAVSVSATNDQDASNNDASAAIVVAAGETDGSTTSGETDSGATTDTSDTGAAELALLLSLLLVLSARLYWLHKRELIVLRK